MSDFKSKLSAVDLYSLIQAHDGEGLRDVFNTFVQALELEQSSCRLQETILDRVSTVAGLMFWYFNDIDDEYKLEHDRVDLD